MRTGRRKKHVPKKHVIVFGEGQRGELERLARSRSLPHGLVRLAKMIFWSADGLTDTVIAKRLHCKHQTLSHWRKRFVAGGVRGLSDAPKSGRPRTIDDERAAGLLNKALRSKPKGRSHWSVRAEAEETGDHMSRTFNRLRKNSFRWVVGASPPLPQQGAMLPAPCEIDQGLTRAV